MLNHDTTRFDFPINRPVRKNIAGLHSAIKRLGIRVAEDEESARKVGFTTKNAITQIQSGSGIVAT